MSAAIPCVKTYPVPNWLVSHSLLYIGMTFDLAPVSEGRKRIKFVPNDFDICSNVFYVSIDRLTPDQLETIRALIPDNALEYAKFKG